ncbi:sensor histidine kinase [Pseudovibrio japonicus]|uniref:sensor histidine kinase n=1 Tax=Pseudovibrio japonicus TaxID=366534 RepID=UPI0016737695|nr:HAMP domain-containing sensor histidine kinase [Pseudovibrio japonicus]
MQHQAIPAKNDLEINTSSSNILRSNIFAGYLFLISIWLLTYKSADLFNYFASYTSLWFLPAGANLAIVLAVPMRFILAPLIANLLISTPIVCALLGIEWTNYSDPVLHGLRLYLVYGGAGLVLRLALKIHFPISRLRDSHWSLGITLLAAGAATISGLCLHLVAGNFSSDVAYQIAGGWLVGDAIGAIILPPLLVPLLKFAFSEEIAPPEDLLAPNFQVFITILICVSLVLSASFIGYRQFPGLSFVWYAIILPPIFFALYNGVFAAAVAVVCTAIFAPIYAHFLGFEGERFELQLLLLVTSLVALTIGAAITDRTKAMQTALKHEQLLEEQVDARTQELQQAYEFQRHLIRSIGHDVRQPLQTLNFLLDGMAADKEQTEGHMIIKNAQTVSRSATMLIDKVMEFARREMGHTQPAITATNTSDIWLALSSIFEPIAAQKDVTLEFDATDIVFSTDKALIVEALSNLLENSIRFSRTGQRVRVEARQSAEQVEFVVSDEVEMPVTKQEQQTGFGLGIVTQICGLLNGEFSRQSNEARIALIR